MIGLFAGLSLIIFRGYPYTHNITGFYLYLFYQNLTNLFFLTMTFILIFNKTYDVYAEILNERLRKNNEVCSDNINSILKESDIKEQNDK